MLRFAWRSVLLLAIICAYLRPWAQPETGRYCRRTLRVLGIAVRESGPRRGRAGTLIVANHLSWLDPLVFFASQPATFVTSVEVAETPLLGWLCRRAGCLFVERRRRRSVRDDCQRLARALAGHAVVVFPEATSSDGRGVLPFRPSSFESARSQGARLQPAAIRYCRVGGRPLGRRWVDRLHWYGDMAFLPHLLGVLALPRVEVALRWLPAMAGPATAERKGLARRMQRQVAEAYAGLLPAHV